MVGAGCSLEAPTSLKLSEAYAGDVHDELVADGVLSVDECTDPIDLSLLAEVVYEKTGSQEAVVKRLPRRIFRMARANRGYLLAAAMLQEGALTCIITLNFDLAMTDALRQIGGTDVDVINGPSRLDEFGSRAVIYLHGNVEEPDFERWILRRSVLDAEWRDNWQEVVVSRVVALPALVFVGLGSPAALLSESVKRIQEIAGNAFQVYLVDPSTSSPFASQLALQPDRIVIATWCEFMDKLAARIADDFCRSLSAEAKALTNANDWPQDTRLDGILAAFQEAGLLALGRARSLWLCMENSYAPDTSESRPPMAYLSLAISELTVHNDCNIRVSSGGLIEITQDDRVVCRVILLHGRGVLRQAAAEARLAAVVDDWDVLPDVVITGGMIGSSLEDLSPPADIIPCANGGDILQGMSLPRFVDFESVRGQGRAIQDLVA